IQQNLMEGKPLAHTIDLSTQTARETSMQTENIQSTAGSTQTEDDPFTKELLARIMKHINRAREYLEDYKGYEWDQNFNILSNPEINAITEAEKQISKYLEGNISDKSFESANEEAYETPSPVKN